MKRIFLIGYMGSGKTTAGRELAEKLKLEFVDLDRFIQVRYKKTVSQLFEEIGETEFRTIESTTLKEVGKLENVLVSTGGGTPCFFDNMDFMNTVGTTVYLKASPEALTARLNTPSCKEKRPLIKDKNEEELYTFIKNSLNTRNPFYTKAQIIFENEELINRDEIDGYIQKLIVML